MAVTNLTNTQLANQTNNKTNSSKKSTNTNGNSFSTYVEKESTKTYKYTDIFKAASKKYNISQKLLEAVAFTESSFNPNATSYCGAQGLMQLMPATAKSLGVNDAYNPIENVMGGAKYLSQMLKKYNGDTSLALAAYNGGPGNVAKHNGVPSFCQKYVDKVESYIKKGVNVPNKTFTVSSNSYSNKLLEQYGTIPSKSTNNDNQTLLSKKTNTTAPLTTKNVLNNTSNKITNYEELYTYASNKYNVPNEILKAISYTQSAFKADAISSSGAIGLMQLMPSTAAELGVNNPYDPIENVMGGAKYLSQLLNKYNGNITYAIAAYSTGMGNVDSYKGVPPFAQNFVNKVITLSKKGVSIPNIELNNSLFSNNNSNSQKHNNNKEETKTKKLIDLQI